MSQECAGSFEGVSNHMMPTTTTDVHGLLHQGVTKHPDTSPPTTLSSSSERCISNYHLLPQILNQKFNTFQKQYFVFFV